MSKHYKFLSIVIVGLLLIAALSSNVYASGTNLKLNNNDIMDTLEKGNILIVIFDENGNIVETHVSSRAIYVNGTQYTIPANGSLRTYQYYASINFSAGFYFVHPDHSGYATTRNRNVKITIRNSYSVGGTRYYVKSKTFSTNEENNTNDPGYSTGIQPGCASVALSATPVPSLPYYDALYENKSSKPMTISLLVAKD